MHLKSHTQVSDNVAIILFSMTSISVLYQGCNQTRGKQKPPSAKTQELAEQAYEELLDFVETVPRNYVLDDSK